MMEVNPLPHRMMKLTALNVVGASTLVMDDEIDPSQALMSEVEMLNDFPPGISPDYKPIPLAVKILLNASSVGLSAVIENGFKLSWKAILQLIGKAVIFSFTATTLMQDLFYKPSRISLSQQVTEFNGGGRNLLPSMYSNLQPIAAKFSSKSCTDLVNGIDTVQNNADELSLVTHFLRYDGKKDNKEEWAFDALHCSHGFGASSLSWLPALPLLVDSLKAKIGLAHDTAGFGFTERPDAEKDLSLYSLDTSGAIGSNLMIQEVNKRQNLSSGKSILLFGHSMGSIPTLLMAQNLHSCFERIKIVLVAPAIMVSQSNPTDESHSLKKRKPFRYIQKYIRRAIIEPALRYIIRRIITSQSFWKKGLQSAWGDSNKLSDEDIKRFRWPAIAMNVESGLVSFSRAQIERMKTIKGGDLMLLKNVSNLKNVSISIIHGTKDAVIPISNSEKLIGLIPSINLYPMIDQGHDPFEEDIPEFVDLVQRI